MSDDRVVFDVVSEIVNEPDKRPELLDRGRLCKLNDAVKLGL
jgi:hypothetical protein